MGQRGPAPKPTELRVLHGETGKRINKNEPKPAAGAPKRPSWVTGELKEVWDHTLETSPKGVITTADGPALAAFCQAVVAHAEAARQLQHEDIIVQSSTGSPMKNPLLIVINETSSAIRQFSMQFGMTPASRVGLSVKEEPSSGKDSARLLS